MIRVELWVLGRKTTEVKSPFHHIISRVQAINVVYHFDVNLDHLIEVVFVRFLLSFFHPLFCTLYKEVIIHSTHLRSGELRFTSLRTKYLRKLFEGLHRLVFFPPIYK